MTATHDTILKADRSGRLRLSPEQRFALLQAYQTSGLSGPRFAALHGVKYQTLATWIQKSKQTAALKPKRLSFIAAEVLPGPEPGHSNSLEVILPGGGKIQITDHKKKTKSQPRQPRIPEHLAVIEETLDPPEVVANPSAYRRIGEEVREQLHFKRAEFLRIRLIRGKFVLIDEALAKPIIAPLPPSLQERCNATPALIAEVVDNRFTLHLPYYRQEEMFAALGVNIHRKTLCNWALLASDWLSSIYRELEYEHWRAPYRQFD